MSNVSKEISLKVTKNIIFNQSIENTETEANSVSQTDTSKSDETMAFRNRIISFVLLSSLITLSYLINLSLQENGIIIQKEIELFFDKTFKNESCHVLDSFDGNLDYINSSFESSQFTFIYLYANWCSRSHKFKSLIEDLKCKYSNKISFIAVNCFNPSGTCRQTFDLIKYPEILLQINNVGIFTYQGPYELSYISKYLDVIQSPLTRIDNLDEFSEFVIQNDGAVIGRFDFNNDYDNKLFKMYYQSSIKTYNTNFLNPIRYGIIINETLWSYLLVANNKLKLLESHNQKITLYSMFGLENYYPINKRNVSVDDLTSWTKSNFKRTIKWIYPEKYELEVKKRSELYILIDRKYSLTTEYAIAKYFALEQRLVSMNFRLKTKFHNMIKNHLSSKFQNHLTCCPKQNSFFTKKQIEEFTYCDNTKKEIIRQISVSFSRSLDIYLIDKRLYSNYANDIVHKSLPKVMNQSNAIIIDFRNESVYSLGKQLSYTNLKKFVLNQSFGVNKEIIRSEKNAFKKDNLKDFLIKEINTKKITSIINIEMMKDLDAKDIMIFYYSNWCGHCKLFHYKLMEIMHQYFQKDESVKIYKINCDLNDLPFKMKVNKIPTLLMIHNTKSNQIHDNFQQDSTVFAEDSLTTENVLNFILLNSKNPSTFLNFLKNNFNFNEPKNEIEKKVKNNLRITLKTIIAAKLEGLEKKSEDLSDKILKFKDKYKNTNLTLEIDNIEFKRSDNESNFFKNINNYLTVKLDQCLNNIRILTTVKNKISF